MSRAYAGIGSREVPDDIVEQYISPLAYRLSAAWDLRTGAAPGADTAFIEGALEGGGGIEVYLPWPSFSEWAKNPDLIALWEPQPEAFTIAERLHPAWGHLTSGGGRLHARNVHIILGPDLARPDPVKFVCCWTIGGAGMGGTGGALRVAEEWSVPIYDLALGTTRERIDAWLAEEAPIE